MRPFCHTAEMVKHYTRLGFWGNPVYCEVWDQNALSYGTREDLVDSRGRGVTWETAKKMSDRLALGLLELGFKRDDIIVIQLPNICEHLIIPIGFKGQRGDMGNSQEDERPIGLRPFGIRL